MESPSKTFLETSIFTKKVDEFFRKDELLEIQTILTLNNESGDKIPNSGGLWKLRYSSDNKGKRGGVRLIYYIHKPNEIFLLYLYKKNKMSDLTKDQTKQLKAAVEVMIQGK